MKRETRTPAEIAFTNRSNGQLRRMQREDEQWYRSYTITLPDGSTVDVPNLTKYCAEHDLSYESMKKVAYGKQKQHKGYKCVRNKVVTRSKKEVIKEPKNVSFFEAFTSIFIKR